MRYTTLTRASPLPGCRGYFEPSDRLSLGRLSSWLLPRFFFLVLSLPLCPTTRLPYSVIMGWVVERPVPHVAQVFFSWRKVSSHESWGGGMAAWERTVGTVVLSGSVYSPQFLLTPTLPNPSPSLHPPSLHSRQPWAWDGNTAMGLIRLGISPYPVFWG